MKEGLENLNEVIGDLNEEIRKGIKSVVTIDGPEGIDAQYRRYKRLKQ